MNERAYKTMGITGGVNIVIGIVVIVIGLTAGVISIISGTKLLKNKEGLTF